jgi:hypothetical protein
VVEGALWSAVRVLEEHSDLRRRMAKRASDRGLQAVAEGFSQSADETDRQANTIRALLFGREQIDPAHEAIETDTKQVSVAGRRRSE